MRVHHYNYNGVHILYSNKERIGMKIHTHGDGKVEHVALPIMYVGVNPAFKKLLLVISGQISLNCIAMTTTSITQCIGAMP